jgi:lipopolysaccharide transport system ATP-binding protein
MLIKTTSGVELGGASSAPTPAEGIDYVASGTSIRVEYRFVCSLNPGLYFVNAGVSGDVLGENKHLHRIIDAHCFRVFKKLRDNSTGIIDFSCVPEITL